MGSGIDIASIVCRKVASSHVESLWSTNLLFKYGLKRLKQSLTQHVFRHWQSRRVVITRDVIAFAYVGDYNMVDYIPLCDITSIENIDHRHFNSSKRLFEQDVHIEHALTIQTTPSGYNSGRKYIVQAASEDERNQLVVDIKRLVQLASSKAISGFKRRQSFVRNLYNSNVVQSIASLLIALVRTVLSSGLSKSCSLRMRFSANK
jgi:hypothetical protein